MLQTAKRAATAPRHSPASRRGVQTLRPKPNHPIVTPSAKVDSVRDAKKKELERARALRHVKRNEVGVQLLSRSLHEQIFRNVSFPQPPRSYIQIAKEHLAQHELDPVQGSILPDIGFQLPPLQGSNLLEHFHRIGLHAAEPWLSLSKEHASAVLPPKPEYWEIQSGWTKYHFLPDGSSYHEHVDFPVHGGKPESMLTFDVETMPKHHPYAVMACAASENAWYAWISPWLLGETDDPQHLIPMGDPHANKVVIGHNISYDRARIGEEYRLEGTQTRFIDTMSLHAAVYGISSHQRPAWMKHRKARETELRQLEEAIEVFRGLIKTAEERMELETDPQQKEEYRQTHLKLSKGLLELQTTNAECADEVDGDASPDPVEKRWEDITAVNSLAEVAKLHCGIEVNKDARDDLFEGNIEEVRNNLHDYLDYCCNDVHITHEVYKKILPSFLQSCPHPVSFAGILTMGSSFLPVNQEWEAYIERAEKTYRDMQAKVEKKLVSLAEDALKLMDNEAWKSDPWLSQLDWTPKVASKSRGVYVPEDPPLEEITPEVDPSIPPTWFDKLSRDPLSTECRERIIPHLLRLTLDDKPLQYTVKEGWHFLEDSTIQPLPTATSKRTGQILNARHARTLLQSGQLHSPHTDLALLLSSGSKGDDVKSQVLQLAEAMLAEGRGGDVSTNPWLSQLDWSPAGQKKKKKEKPPKPPPVLWPKWYWEATKPRKGVPPGTLDITTRGRIAPLLLRLSWKDWPLTHSREHGWIYRVPPNTDAMIRSKPLDFYDNADAHLNELKLHHGYQFYKLPHKDGEKANVGSPLGKTFIKYAQDGTLKSPGDEAKEAFDLNAICSYWISARDRIMNQMVVWEKQRGELGFPKPAESPDSSKEKWGIIVPQVVTMGTVTRRAIEKTWLTASNAKKNRVGSELKAMVRAPEGYAIVGADVDSEELWISSCMGDAQFGLHGATAIGWMTLEGTKAAGTDLHSKTAKILGISRDQAKVFNYSRIYGAGMRHAILLLLQGSSAMLPEAAQKLAENLYASTKGKNTHRTDIFERKFWFGGSESYLFNKLEEIALSDKPQTPALGCGVTYALSKEYLPTGFGSDYLPSRINWVVQSSGVDYLHLLIVSMQYLIQRYNINARYLISVHDELRYLVTDQDKYRLALALQIANLWTRCMFAYKLGMDDLPQGVAFFSAVDVDKVLRKEVFMPCTTPSQPDPIPSGESLDIAGVLEKTNGGSLFADGRSMPETDSTPLVGNLEGFQTPDCLVHRAPNAAWLRAQATTDFAEIKALAQQVYGKHFDGDLASSGKKQRRAAPRRPNGKKIVGIGSGEGYDWSAIVDNLLSHEGVNSLMDSR
ncbi:gamma DNA-directed DNA polymerase [Coprinopsis cinerea AmutBmut pab1-1]|nr:gamma DNA-directed DNA polymerase [Coprinopsis cinerea AmutBmut pab1-1]